MLILLDKDKYSEHGFQA